MTSKSVWYEVPSEKNHYISVFKTSDDMWRYADTTPASSSAGHRSSRSENYEFRQVHSFGEAVGLGTTTGWAEGATKMRKARKRLRSINLNIHGSRRKRIISPVGGRVHIPRFLAGDVKHFIRHKRTRTPDGSNVSIGVECGMLGFTSSDEIINRGIAVSALVKAIEDMGISVELTGLHSANGTGGGGYLFTTAHKIKRAGSYVNDERIAMALAHPATHRCAVFSVRETIKKSIFEAQLGGSMGSTTDTPENTRSALGIDYHLGNINSGSFCWSTPTDEEITEWIMSTLKDITDAKGIKTLGR